MADLEKIVALCKRRGFIFPSSDVYGGLSSVFDYGPMGAELKRNIKQAWWKANVHGKSDIYGFDAAILMHPEVWKSSGHVDGFADPLVDCKACKKRFRQDQMKDVKGALGKCPECGAKIDLKDTPPRMFNLMLKTFLGPVEDSAAVCYLRPETAQGMFVNFINMLDSMHPKLPFGIAQIGKAFRNEVTVGNFIFRMREFEQMEIEYFVNPKDDDQVHKKWINERFEWYIGLGIRRENLKKREHAKDELAHYAKACTDIEYNFPFGWSELEGIANRQDFDLREHAKFSGKDFVYFDEETKTKFLPHIIEPSGGVDRSVLAFLCDAYREETVKDKPRTVLSLNKALAPVKAAVLPLLKNRSEVVELAQRLAADLKRCFYVVYDDTAAIGKLYRRQDEIGTPYCVTVDVQSLEDKQVTVRERDTMKQDRIAVDKVKEYLSDKLV
jgi:glycyl-tRNA synthetase